MSKPIERGSKASCRSIVDADLPAVAALLAQGFPGRSVDYWLRGLHRQGRRDLPSTVPQYGYVLESDGRVRAALLVIYSRRRRADGVTYLQCNLSSWFVDPAFRGYASLLTSIAQRNRDVTYLNLTAARHTWPIIEAQGFEPACEGLFFSAPILADAPAGEIDVVGTGTVGIDGLADRDVERLREHAALDCLSLVCRTAERPIPFILMPYRIRNGRVPTPAMRLIYAPSLDDYRLCAGALGRFLLRRGRLFIILGANGQIPGLAGLYTARRGRRYVRGPHPPDLCDLTDSELVLFGA